MSHAARQREHEEPARGRPHLAVLQLDRLRHRLDEFRELLSADELERSERFYLPRDRSRYVVGRGILRRILGQYTSTTPERVRFVYGQRGKPALAGSDGEGATLRFNASGSQGRMAIVVGRDGDLGVDIETLRPVGEWRTIVELYFHVQERPALLGHPGAEEAFLHCWTLKEALVKLDGRGLQVDLDAFAVTVDPTAVPSVRWTGADPPKVASAWTFCAGAALVAVASAAPIVRVEEARVPPDLRPASVDWVVRGASTAGWFRTEKGDSRNKRPHGTT